MFARNLAISLKPNALAEFTQKLENEVVPVLRKQHGFRDEIILLSEDNIHVHAIGLWDSREAAEAYDKAAYLQVLKSLETLVAGSPKVRVSTVLQSTVHNGSARRKRSLSVARGPERSRQTFLSIQMLARRCPTIAGFCRNTSLIVRRNRSLEAIGQLKDWRALDLP